jgi:hypothetical protein
MKRSALITASLLLLAGQAGAVEAPTPTPAPRCQSLPEIRETLRTKYNEIEVGGGLVNETMIALLFASPSGETWTILHVLTNGCATPISSGTNWYHDRIPALGERPA